MSCPKCGNPDTWEDNFWSGCHRCGWMSSCESRQVLVPNPGPRRQQDPEKCIYVHPDD